MTPVPAIERLRVEIRGAVQGVGFRPFVYRLATELALAGWVVNDTRGVVLEVEGPRAALERFLARVGAETPQAAYVHALEHAWLPAAGLAGFEIRPSDAGGERLAVLLPELATCAACRAEIADPRERRHGYPFTNCTDCGPRFSIIRALPYDRPNTTMRDFPLCADCRREYEDPRDRRFHAQPIACPACGPALALWDRDGVVLATRAEALARTAAALCEGHIVAVKGLGGFHLMCDAADAAAVARLREGKGRQEKPFALMCRDLPQARTLVEVDETAAAMLESRGAPIVLLPRRADAPADANVAPGLAQLGVMLAYTPLHHLLMDAVGRALVATSGNLTDEPIAIDEREALARLGPIADLLLVHDRPIERHVDDSVGWMVDGEFRLLRRARGYAPLPLRLPREVPTVLAVGGHLKNTVALAIGRQVFVSQHVGDLETPEAEDAFERVIADFLRMYDARPVAIAHDPHPDYVSTRWAIEHGARLPGTPRLVPVQHHYAHLASCLVENGELMNSALGIIWDGTGYGGDGTIWGGEFLVGGPALSAYARIGHLLPFRLPGGEAAVREPRRSAIGLIWEMFGEDALERVDLEPVASFSPTERWVLREMLAGEVNSPVTTSAGRLFDGLAALLGLHPRITYEGQAAIALERLAEPGNRGAYPIALTPVRSKGPRVLDWRPLVRAVLSDLASGVARGIMAARIHAALVAGMVRMANDIGFEVVVLSGGCFQNRLLLEGATHALDQAGFRVLAHRQVPPNDGGLSLGQAAVAAVAAAHMRGE